MILLQSWSKAEENLRCIHKSVTKERKIITKSKIIAVLLVFVLSSAFSVYAGPIDECKEHVKYGIPSKDNPVLLCRKGYLLSHDNNHKIPFWVAYHLTKKMASGTIERKDSFRPDPDLPKGERAELGDYRNSGYQRGHMFPSDDAAWDKDAMAESFYLSNMTPQLGRQFNNSTWKTLEKKIRQWAKDSGELYIYVGPILATNRVRTIGKNKVAIPTHFFKVVYDPKRQEAIGFLFPHSDLRGTKPEEYIKRINFIEREAGLDFLSDLPTGLQQSLESEPAEMWQ